MLTQAHYIQNKNQQHNMIMDIWRLEELVQHLL